MLSGGLVLLAAFVVIENRVTAPMIQLGLFRLRAFTAGNIAGLAISIGRGGMQFVLIVWLQGIWLPLYGYEYSATPLWAGIFMLPLTAGFLAAGPVSGYLSDRLGSPNSSSIRRHGAGVSAAARRHESRASCRLQWDVGDIPFALCSIASASSSVR